MQHDRAILLIVLAALGVFAGALANGFVWDDTSLIFADGRSFSQLLTTGFWAGASEVAVAQDFYRPAVSIALWAQRSLFGEAALGFHLVSLALHAACGVLAYRWVVRRVGADAMVPALLAALLFVVHPSRVESVAWVSGSTDLWLTFWLLAGFEAGRAKMRGSLAIAATCWLLAALSKETGLLVPLLIVADHLLLDERPATRPLIAATTTTVVAFALRSAVVDSPRLDALMHADTPARVLASLGHYVLAIVWPWQPSVTVGTPNPLTESGWLLPGAHLALGAVTCAALPAIAIAARRRPAIRPVLADAAWFVVPLAPVLNLLPLGYQTFVAERFLYLPLLGVCALLARTLAALARGGRQSARRAVAIAVGLVLVAAAISSARHVGHFFDDVELWSYEKTQHPDDARVSKWLAEAYRRAGLISEAKAEVVTALDLAPPAWTVLRAELAVEWGVLEATSGPDAEQDRIRAARALLDTLAEPQTDTIHVQLGARAFELAMDERVRARLASSEPLRDHRILAHLRTLQLDTAELLARKAAAEEANPAYAMNHALVLVTQERWADAEQRLRVASSDPMLTEFADRIAELRNRLSAAQPIESVLVRAEFLREVGSREAARRLVGHALEASPADPQLVEAATEIDLADGAPALARARLEKLTVDVPSPSWQPLLEKVRAQLAAFEE